MISSLISGKKKKGGGRNLRFPRRKRKKNVPAKRPLSFRLAVITKKGENRYKLSKLKRGSQPTFPSSQQSLHGRNKSFVDFLPRRKKGDVFGLRGKAGPFRGLEGEGKRGTSLQPNREKEDANSFAAREGRKERVMLFISFLTS